MIVVFIVMGFVAIVIVEVALSAKWLRVLLIVTITLFLTLIVSKEVWKVAEVDLRSRIARSIYLLLVHFEEHGVRMNTIPEDIEFVKAELADPENLMRIELIINDLDKYEEGKRGQAR